jgi:hypothetical protein
MLRAGQRCQGGRRPKPLRQTGQRELAERCEHRALVTGVGQRHERPPSQDSSQNAEF